MALRLIQVGLGNWGRNWFSLVLSLHPECEVVAHVVRAVWPLGSSPRESQVISASRLTRSYCSDRGIEYSLLWRFWLVARREEGSIAAALYDPTSNNATSQKRRNPPGRGQFALGLRCALGRVSLRIHSLPRASPQGKLAPGKLCSIPRSEQ